MLNGSSQPSNEPLSESARAWYKELNGYHWFVLIVCTLGWLFDCLDQQLFNLARQPAVTQLLGVPQGSPAIDLYSGMSTTILMIGWATGGIIFGIMGDRLGRARTMIFTILAYSVFTGLSGFAVTLWDFLFFRFLAGLGVGGQFAVGVSLVAESVPQRARPHALGMLQAFSAIGNVAAGVISLVLLQLVDPSEMWRWMFAVGIVPAFLVVIVMRYLKEPEAWKKAVAERKDSNQAGSVAELFGSSHWRRRTIVGMVLAAAGVIGLWGIGVFSNDLTQTIFRKEAQALALEQGQDRQDLEFARLLAGDLAQLNAADRDRLLKVHPRQLVEAPDHNDTRDLASAAIALVREEKAVNAETVLAQLDAKGPLWKAQSTEERARRAALLAESPAAQTSLAQHIERLITRQDKQSYSSQTWAAVNLMLFNIGAFVGMYLFARVTTHIGRRPTFAIFFAAALVSTAIYFLFMNSREQLYWMAPLMGCFQLSVFGGYAIYFPELFPTRLRATGTSFCYNIARYLAAAGPAALGWLASTAFASHGEVDRFRYAGAVMCACYLVGIVALLFAPETKDQPLPE